MLTFIRNLFAPEIILREVNGEIKEVKVWSLKSSKNFFVHRSSRFHRKIKRKNWTVTHRPTGLAVKQFDNLPDAKLFLDCCDILDEFKPVANLVGTDGVESWVLDSEQAHNLALCFDKIYYSRMTGSRKHESVIDFVYWLMQQKV